MPLIGPRGPDDRIALWRTSLGTLHRTGLTRAMEAVTNPRLRVDTSSTRVDARMERRRRSPAWTVPVAAYLASRVVVYVASLASTWISPAHFSVVSTFTSWDSAWYLRIAQTGYPSDLLREGGGNSWAFFPGLPTLIRGVHEATTLSYVDAGVVVAAITGLTGTVAVWIAVRHRFGDQIANRTAVLLVFFPTAFVLSMAYTEGLFLTLAALCLFFIDRRRWYAAAFCAAGASLTRNVGVVLIVCIGVAAVSALFRDREVRPVVAAVLSALPLVGWLVYAHARTGEFLPFLKADQLWSGAHFVWFTAPFQAIGRLLTGSDALDGTPNSSSAFAPDLLAAFAVVFVAVGVTLIIRRRLLPLGTSSAWWIFIVGGIAGAFSPYQTTSILRYTMVVFPLFVGIALWRLRHFDAIVGSLALAEGVLAVVVFSTTGAWHAPIIAP